MAKNKIVYICQQCGYESIKWLGKCPGCNSWNSMVEEEKQSTNKTIKNINIKSEPKIISTIKSSEYERLDTGINELNRVLGGGIVKGSLTLISGSPGIGKSTILLQAANNIATKYGKILYVSGEESEEQIKMRADRLKVISKDIYILSETNVDIIKEHITTINPKFVIIDSIQTLFKSELSSAPGTVSQVRQCSNDIMLISKSNNIPFFYSSACYKTRRISRT